VLCRHGEALNTKVSIGARVYSSCFPGSEVDHPRDRDSTFLLIAIAAVGSRGETLGIFPPAILLVLTGVVLALVPGLPAAARAQSLSCLLVLPPLIYSSAVAMSWREFRFNLRPISLLAIGCVVFTTVRRRRQRIGSFLGLSLAGGVRFWAAIVSPPDAVAPLAIARMNAAPKRILVILEGEGLANDATALIPRSR